MFSDAFPPISSMLITFNPERKQNKTKERPRLSSQYYQLCFFCCWFFFFFFFNFSLLLSWPASLTSSRNCSLPFKFQVAMNSMWKECQHLTGVGASGASQDLGEQVGMNFALRSSGSLRAREGWEMRAWGNLSWVWWRNKNGFLVTWMWNTRVLFSKDRI